MTLLDPYDRSRILLVEDDDEIRETMTMFLGSNGFHVTSASDGLIALRCLEEGQGHFLAVLTDFQMPNMNGLELIAEIRKRSYPVSLLLLVSSQANFNPTSFYTDYLVHFLTKPYLPERIVEILSRVRRHDK